MQTHGPVRWLACWLVSIAAFAAGPGLARAATGQLAELALGIDAYNAHEFSTAAEHLREAGKVPKLQDYAAYYLASSEQQLHRYESAVSVLDEYRKDPVSASPLAGKISLLEARVLLDERQPAAISKALTILEKDHKLLPEPDGDFAMGLVYEAQGEQQQAALVYERVYYGAPNTDLAAESWTALERLRAGLGKDFPTATPRQELDRCQRWLDARQYRKAREEYTKLAGLLKDSAKDEARVGVGVSDSMAGDNALAFRDLKALHIGHSEIDAERLYYLTEAARKLGDEAAMMEAVQDLKDRYAESQWRMKALLAAGNRYEQTNSQDKYTPLLTASFKDFAFDSSTSDAHWRVAWDVYLNGAPTRVPMLREQLEKYPGDSHTGAALYFLGRIAENDSHFAEARAYYERLSEQYPHFFYGVLARDRLKQTKVTAAATDPETKKWLDNIEWPARKDTPEAEAAAEPNTATRQRLERGRLLLSAGLPDMAEAEFRFGAKSPDEQPHLLAVALAQAQTSPFKALRVMKSMSPDYLAVPTETASVSFWQALFPLPWKTEVVREAEAHGLDPYFVAALIRQESEFNPDAKSHANAYGLMQLIPSTGRMLGRQEGTPVVRTGMLLNPLLNIQLGTRYLKSQLDAWNGNLYQTLAAYNAGPGRVREWLGWMKLRDPVEFVESIPFTETREYVQAVLRNADMYREIYTGKRASEVRNTQDPEPAKSVSPPAPPRTAAKATTRKKTLKRPA